MDTFVRWLVRHPATVVVANLVVTAVLGVYALNIRIDNSLESVLPSGDPQVAYYARTRQIFGSDAVAVVGVRAEDLFAPATLEKVARVTDALGKIEGVERVLSITNAVDPAADVITPPRLLPQIPPTAEQVAALKKKLVDTPLYGKNLVADDMQGAAINVFFKNLTDVEYVDLDIDREIMAVLDAERGPEEFFYTGAAHVSQSAVGFMRRDLLLFTPFALALMLVVLGLSFRAVRAVTLPLVSVGMALVWAIGIMVVAGKAITIGTFILPPLLLVIGGSYATHVMARYYEQVWAEAPGDEVVLRAFQRVWLPLVISALTTVVGFGALMVNRITAIWDLGLFAGVGVVCLTVTSLTFLPAALQLLPSRLRTPTSGHGAATFDAVLTRMGRRAYRSRRHIIWIAVAVALVAVAGADHIRVDSDFLTYFDDESPVRVDNERINQSIVGSNPFYVVIEGGSPGALKHIGVLRLIKDLQHFLSTLPGITSSVSVVDYLELLESGLNTAGSGDLVVDDQGNLVAAERPKPFWEEPRNLEPVLAMVDTSPETFRNVVTADFAKTSVLVRTRLSGSREIETTLARIREYVAGRFPPDIRVRLTGTLVLLTGTTSDIVIGQIRSLMLALAVIFVVLALMFLSAKIGALAILPNVLSIAVLFGVMGWCGVNLNLGTSLIAAITLGVAVDSTIHYMARLNRELQGETDQAAALLRTVRSVGMPIINTSVALFLGFLVFAFSSFNPIRNFGLLASMTMGISLGANLMLLPAVLATTKIITLWDLLSVKLGTDPGRTIPLFSGLTAAQTRIVVLMGELKRFAPGEMIVREGERGDEMYVIIRGQTEVWAGSNAGRRQIAEHHRGDVFGEMALVRKIDRSADVVAASDVEVLAVDEHFLERIQRRYPRIASKVFLNLTRILSDRLEIMTEQYVAVRPT